MTRISVVILTYNEELNIERCLDNVLNWAGEIFIVDSYSNDHTLEIAKKYNINTVQHLFENQARQFNWALDNLAIKNEWVLSLDADEYLTEELKKEIVENLNNVQDSVNGFIMKRRVYFMGRWIRYGGYYPTWILRLFRKGMGRCEDKAMDERIVLAEGVAIRLQNDFIDNNEKGLEFWISKHVKYADREVTDIISKKRQKFSKKFYLSFPGLIRPFLYFIYRYFFRFGFMDGKEGLIFHFLQGFWYRFMVDIKLYEIKKSRKN